MILYHGTTRKAWKEITDEGVLYGRKNTLWCGKPMARLTYLTPLIEVASRYGDVVLEVDMGDIKYAELEYVTYDPIPLSKVRIASNNCFTLTRKENE